MLPLLNLVVYIADNASERAATSNCTLIRLATLFIKNENIVFIHVFICITRPIYIRITQPSGYIYMGTLGGSANRGGSVVCGVGMLPEI